MTRLMTLIAFVLAMSSFLAGCQVKPGHSELSDAVNLLNRGDLTKASETVAKLLKNPGLSGSELRLLDSVSQVCHRIRTDFNLTGEEVLKRLAVYHPGISNEDLKLLENEHKLDFILVDGVKKYFKNCVRNVFLLDSTYHNLKINRDGPDTDSLSIFRLSHTAGVIGDSGTSGELVRPVKVQLKYTIRVDANAVPPGETIRCWMPYPRENHARQQNVRLLSSDPSPPAVSPGTDLQRTIYMEKKALENHPTVFETNLEFTSFAQSFHLSPESIRAYRKDNEFYKKYTAEKPPQIIFSDDIKNLASRVLQNEDNPLLQVRKIYRWIGDSVTWASAIEYSILKDIPGFVIRNRHGDCGMQTLLFMTLARYAGIPVKWQSGWMLHPGNVNLHDWCEVYYEGVGWVPLDQSFGLQESDNQRLREFYVTGIDAYRFIVNDEISEPLTPGKKFMRSEPYDFQRGEVEWKEGNLYFDKWSWNMEVTCQ